MHFPSSYTSILHSKSLASACYHTLKYNIILIVTLFLYDKSFPKLISYTDEAIVLLLYRCCNVHHCMCMAIIVKDMIFGNQLLYRVEQIIRLHLNMIVRSRNSLDNDPW